MEKAARTCLVEERKRHRWSQQEVADRLGTTRHNVSRWEAGLTTPGPYFRAKLCALFSKSAEELELIELDHSLSSSPNGHMNVLTVEQASPPQARPFALWTVPSGRNPHFTGRDELLARLDQHIAPMNSASTFPRPVALTQTQAITGLGGIGKTQIAIEYAYRTREQGYYTHILWINAASEETILSSFVTLANLLPALSAENERNQQKLVKAVKHWLEESQQPWLLIFDNADDISLLPPYFPQKGNGSLLLTTRDHAVGSLAISIEVESMGLMEGTTFLLQRTQRQQVDADERDEATNVVIALAGFPLALDQAGAYIEETGCSFREYLQLYQDHRRVLLARRGRQTTNYPDSIATTWSLSFQKVAESEPAAAELLHLCAFLAPDAIPEELLSEGAAYWPPLLQQTVTDRLSFNHLLEELLRFSLITRRLENRLLCIHRLVQVVQRDTIEEAEQRTWAERVVQAVHAVFPRDSKGDIASWPRCLRYLEQAQACDGLIQQYNVLLPEAAELLERAGVYLNEHASYSLTEPLFQRVLEILEKLQGSEHPAIARVLGELAYLYYRQGRYSLSEEAYERALHMLNQVGGPDDRQITAVVHNNLANLYYEQGKYRLAEPLYERALHLREEEVGPDHPRIASPLNNLALLYQELGKYTLAEALNLRALRLWERARGPEHPDVAFGLNGLAELYVKQGKYEEAEPLFRRTIFIREQLLGVEHPNVAYPLHGLAELFVKLGKYEEAESLLQRALRIWEKGVGADHDATAYALHGLAHLSVQRDQKDLEQAEMLFQRTLRIREQQLGAEHPEVASLLSDLADLYREQRKYAEAELLYQRAIAIWEQQLGPEHPYVAHALHGLASLYSIWKRCAEAEPLFQQALSIQERVLGEHHLETAETLHSFALFREKQARLQDAVSLYQRALSIREQILGTEHLKTTETRKRGEAISLALGRVQEMERKHEKRSSTLEKTEVGSLAEEGGELRGVLPVCPHCQSSSAVVKSGTNRSGSLRFRCQNCQHYFTPQLASRGYDSTWKEQAVLLVSQGRSYRFIARQLGVSHRTIRTWVQAQLNSPDLQ